MSSFHIWHRILKPHMVTLKRRWLFYNHWGPLCGSYIFQGVEVDKPARQSSSQLIGLRTPNSPHIIETSPCGLKVVSQIYSVCHCYHLVAFIFPMALLRTVRQGARRHMVVFCLGGAETEAFYFIQQTLSEVKRNHKGIMVRAFW